MIVVPFSGFDGVLIDDFDACVFEFVAEFELCFGFEEGGVFCCFL